MAGEGDTIFALSSGRPPAAIAVVRLSGPMSRFVIETLGRRLPEPRRASLMKLREAGNSSDLDDALVLWLPGPGSETGEDMVELHLHGGKAVVATMLTVLGNLPRLRPAEAGEFARRAFKNGKLDLTAVEGLGDLLLAETEAQRRQAMRQFRGALHDRAEQWRGRLVRAMALVEAAIDFADEEDIGDDAVVSALEVARQVGSEVEQALADERRGERLRDGLTVAIAGPPNAGKSSLLNCIARREAAIVSPYAGTTRDVIEVYIDLDGYPITLLDTAGIRQVDDPVEKEGVRRARARAQCADLVLWTVDAGAGRETADLRETLRTAAGQTVWVVWNKLDLVANPVRNGPQTGCRELPCRQFGISAATGMGLEQLVSALGDWARATFDCREPVLITRERHRSTLRELVGALKRATSLEQAPEDIVAEELRLAARALGRLTGRIDVEDVLDTIFKDFCIGK